eukprot:Opistho-1_new@53431
MRIVPVILLLLFFSQSRAQFPYVKKLNYPEQLPTQVVYDMLTDSKGYIWLGTDKGLYRFNGRTFVTVPFDNTSSRAVSYLQEDAEGTIWCMNFYNQLFSFHKDTLRKFAIDQHIVKGSVTFNNVVVGPKQVWFHSFRNIYTFNKQNHKLIAITNASAKYDPILTSVYHDNRLYAFSNQGNLFVYGQQNWTFSGQVYGEMNLISAGDKLVGLGKGIERGAPFSLSKGICQTMPPIDLPPDIYIFQGIFLDNKEFWICTQNGAYKWNTETGETKCYFPNERVSDVVKDYQGNYWFSTLDNGVFICSSLFNMLLKVYNDPLQDNFTKITALPGGEILTGNSQGLLSQVNLETMENFRYTLDKARETEFISYDTSADLIFTNRGVFKPKQPEPIEIMDYSKGITRDKFGNLIFVAFNGAYVINDQYKKPERMPILNCDLYQRFMNDTVYFDSRAKTITLRQKRGLSVLASVNKDCFWIGYEDGLYQYKYDGDIQVLKDDAGEPVIAKSLQQQYAHVLCVD